MPFVGWNIGDVIRRDRGLWCGMLFICRWYLRGGDLGSLDRGLLRLFGSHERLCYAQFTAKIDVGRTVAVRVFTDGESTRYFATFSHFFDGGINIHFTGHP